MDTVEWEIKPFLDEDGRLKQYPAKRGKQLLALNYLATKFETEKRYTEREVNDLLNSWHTFGDWALLRRDMYDVGHLGRSNDGAEYWVKTDLDKIENKF